MVLGNVHEFVGGEGLAELAFEEFGVNGTELEDKQAADVAAHADSIRAQKNRLGGAGTQPCEHA